MPPTERLTGTPASARGRALAMSLDAGDVAVDSIGDRETTSELVQAAGYVCPWGPAQGRRRGDKGPAVRPD
jgi:hypothetical protein